MVIFIIHLYQNKEKLMKKFTFFFIIMFNWIPPLSAQVKMSGETHLSIHRIQKTIAENRNYTLDDLQQFPAMKLNGAVCISFLAKVNHDFDASLLENNYQVYTGSRTGDIVSFRIPVQQLNNAENLPGINYLQIAEKIRPDLNRVVLDVGADSVHNGIGLPQPFTGKDVIIGVTDWGFDYTHPMFYDTALVQSRILAAWDQFKTSGPHPTGYNYGTEYADETALLTAESDTSNIYKVHYHGTHVAGIAGGGGAGIAYRGLAFEANFLFCTFLVDEAAVLDAFNWMKTKADTEGKRLVINMSWGLYYMGTLDGNGLISQAIDNLSNQGVTFVTSGGNNGDVDFHIKKDFNQDTMRTRVIFYSYAANTNMWGQSISIWGEAGNVFSTAIAIYNSSGQYLSETPFYSTNLISSYVDTFLVVNSSDTIFYNISADNSHPLNGRPQMRMRIKNKTTNRVCLYSTADSGTVHYWNVTELTTGVGNWGMDFNNMGLSGWSQGNNQYGVGEPACTESVISVAAYMSKWGTGGGYIAPFSSIGPRIDGKLKPDISAPGMNVTSSINSYTDANYGLPTTTVTFNSRSYPFAKLSGTSMSSPCVAGIVALMLNANHWLEPSDIKNILLETAREDVNTGDLPDTGSVQWGHGKVDAYQAVLGAFYFVSNQEIDASDLILYPNPSSDIFHIIGLDQNQTYHLTIYSMQGSIVFKKSHFTDGNEINLEFLDNGIYIFEIKNQYTLYRTQLIKTGY